MKIACSVISVFLLVVASTSAEYVICASSDHSDMCEKMEASGRNVKCLRVADSVDCLEKLLARKAHLGAFAPEEIILASGRVGEEVRVVAELRRPEESGERFAFETVVVVPRSFVGGFSALKSSVYCHPGFVPGRQRSDRVLKYFESKVMSHFDGETSAKARGLTADEEELRKLSEIFGKSCRPGRWSVSDSRDKKLKREYESLCAKCDSPSTCSYNSEADNEQISALKCLTERNGNVAYTDLSSVKQYFGLNSTTSESFADPKDYKFLCEDGSTRELSATNPCSWIRQPWTAVLTLRSETEKVVQLLNDVTEPDLNFSPWKTALNGILGGEVSLLPKSRKLSDYVQEGRVIPKSDPIGRSVRWCTISEKEKAKCEYMSSAAFAFGLPVRINCTSADSKVDCLRKILSNESDVTYIDTQLGFAARKVYNLTSVAFVETEEIGNYYGVVVTKGAWLHHFRDLRGKKACFPVYNGLGWLSHVHNIRRLNLVPEMLCSDSRGVWNYFSKVCAPGAKSHELNKFSSLTPNKLCEACPEGGKGVFCGVTPRNPYYSEIGALRCLNNGDGDVAVLDFHAIKQLFQSGSNETIGLRLDQFKILCRDESLKDFSLDNPEQCSITQLNGGEIVTRENLPENVKKDVALTLVALNDLFGHGPKEYPPTFRMFEPFQGETGLLFKNSTVALVSVYNAQSEYVSNYLKLQSEMSSCYRDNSSAKIYISLLVIFPALILIFSEN